MYIRVCLYGHECKCLKSTVEGDRFPGAAVTGRCETPNLGAGN